MGIGLHIGNRYRVEINLQLLKDIHSYDRESWIKYT